MPNDLTGGASGATDSTAARTTTSMFSAPAVDLTQLQSHDQAQLLGAIDKLRREHIDAELHIPQIVVCGDQSSGKSSVLEAIAGVSFPLGASTTTRFATEVILRKSDVPELKVQLCASRDRIRERRKEIEDFKPPFLVTGPQDFGRVIVAAAAYLQRLEPLKRFWTDWLRAEISGPEQPHLTVVDLPGIIQSEDGANAIQGDKDKIKSLVRKYLDDPRTTVLAVIDAQNDVANQEIFSLIRTSDGTLNKTLGVITKPDRLPDGSDLQKNVISLAKNELKELRLGWHVLKNLPHETTLRSPAVREPVERAFFATGVWAQLERRDVGIANLRKKLSDQLFKSIATELPRLLVEMRTKLRECKDRLGQLGPGRETLQEQRAYLSDVLNKINRLVEAALDGDYEKSEFSTFFNGEDGKALRDSITSLTVEFASDMRTHGHQFHVFADQTSDRNKTRCVRIELAKTIYIRD